MEQKDHINLLGLNKLSLVNFLKDIGEKEFRSNQLIKWIHRYNCESFQEMTNISLNLKKKLNEIAYIKSISLKDEYISKDKTIKWLFDIDKNNAIETVYIPTKTRRTLCISSQVGCAVNCSFCSTGKQGFNRNLSTHEIIGQLWFAKKTINNLQNNDFFGFKSLNINSNNIITNVVMMGMGEPLLNYDQLLPALNLMLDDNAYGLSRRKITVSTSGIIPMIYKLAKDCPVSLAISLHAPNNNLRDILMPINIKYPIKELLNACEMYIKHSPKNFITFEYCMIKNVNDSKKHAYELVNILKNINCKINIIPFNSFPNSKFECSNENIIADFVNILSQAGLITTIRKTRGDDIYAACGQLAGNVQDRTKITFINKNK